MSDINMDTLYSTCTASKESGLSTRQLYYWELIGLIQPRYETFGVRRFRRYTRQDLEMLKQAKAMLEEGYTLSAVKSRLGKGQNGNGRL